MNRRALEAEAKRHDVAVTIDRPRRDEIDIELMAPEGQRFSGSSGHVLVTHFYSDAAEGIAEAHRDLLANLPLEPCDEDCEG